jgi:hypothetical protein
LDRIPICLNAADIAKAGVIFEVRFEITVTVTAVAPKAHYLDRGLA